MLATLAAHTHADGSEDVARKCAKGQVIEFNVEIRQEMNKLDAKGNAPTSITLISLTELYAEEYEV